MTGYQILVGTGDGVVRTSPDAADAPGGENGERLLPGTAVTALHPSAERTWVLADRRTLHRVDADGPAEVASLDDRVGSCVIEHGGSVFVGGNDAQLWRLDGGDLVLQPSFRSAPTSDRWSTPWGGPPDVFSMADSGDDLYVGVHVGGIMRSSDGGRSWTPTIDLDEDVHRVVADERGDLWAATGHGALAHSTDRGATWAFHAAGLHGTYLLTVAVAGADVLVGASSGPHADDGALYRFDGDAFERCGAGLPADLGGAVGPRRLAAAGDVAAVALPSGDVHASVDGGRSWAQVAERLPNVSEVVVRRCG